MLRIALTDGSGRWFNAQAATVFDEENDWNGNNPLSRATGSQWEHERLFRTAGGRWVIEHSSQWQGSLDSYVEIDDGAAARWLSSNGLEPHQACADAYAALEIK